MSQATTTQPQAETQGTPVNNENAAVTVTKKASTRKSKAEKQAALNTAEGAAVTTAPAEPEDPKEPGKIEQIIALHTSGLSNKEIVAKGFNKTTVSIQVAKYKKLHPELYPAVEAAPVAAADGTDATIAVPAAAEAAPQA